MAHGSNSGNSRQLPAQEQRQPIRESESVQHIIKSVLFGGHECVAKQDVFINDMLKDGWQFVESVPVFGNMIILRFSKIIM